MALLQRSTAALIARAVLAALCLCLAYFFVRLYQVRTHVRNVSKKYGIPILPHSFLWGHLRILGECMQELPSDVYGTYAPHQLLKNYPELDQGLYYMDTWPFQDPMIAVNDPDLVAQFTTDPSMPKAPGLTGEFRPLTGGHDILCYEGQAWKHWRNMFNPAFSQRNLTALVPVIVQEALTFRRVLEQAAASGETFLMEHATSWYAMDVSGHLILGNKLETQKKRHPTIDAFRRQIGQLGYGVWMKHYNPVNYLRRWINNATIDAGFTPMIKRYFSPGADEEDFKTILKLARDSYISCEGKHQADGKVLSDLLPQLKILMIAGYDTTGIALAFAYYFLSMNPKALKALRREHDEVLGPVEEAAHRLSSNPSLVYQLPYTNGVIKEALRINSPVSTIRYGAPGKFLVDDKGRRFPTEGFVLLSDVFHIHRSEKTWHRPLEFLPERWMARDKSDPLYEGPHTKNAFRPFELGPRGCLGQELALVDMRIALALTVREFDFESAYPADAPRVLGSPCYNAQLYGEVTAHCSMRCPLKLRPRKG